MKQTKLTGYPSIDKPWLKYYSKEAINAPLPECTIYEYLWENNKLHLDDIAIIYYEKKITYWELFKKIDRVAAAFAYIGVKKGDVVTMLVLNQPETVYCLYALNKIGAIPTVINVLSSPKEIVHYMEECDSRYLVVLDALFEKAYSAFRLYPMQKMVYLSLFQSRGVVSRTAYRMKVKQPKAGEKEIISWPDFLHGTNAEVPAVRKDPKTCAIIGHTGGTTGTPKGVLLSDNAFNSIPAQYNMIVPHHRQESFLNLIVPHATYGVIANIHLPLSLGMKVILIPKVDPVMVDKTFIEYKPNYVPSIPLYWNAVIDSKIITDLSFLKWASSGGSGLSQERIEKFNLLAEKCHSKAKMLIGYGMTEVCSLACTQMNWNAVAGSVGFPLPHNIISAFDPESMEEKTYNQVGEICMRGPSVMLGYIGNEEETKKMIRMHSDGQVWIHSGDLGYVDENGNVFIQGRIKRIYLTMMSGLHSKIFPDRIEQTLSKHPDIRECGVVCIATEKNVYTPFAFCSLKNEKSEEELTKELVSLAKDDLPEYDLPVKYIFVQTLPRTSQGKIDYRALEERAAKEA